MRGIGTTTKQILNAPYGAFFVWVDNNLNIPKTIAKVLGREDLKIISLSEVRMAKFVGMKCDVVIDHFAAIHLNTEQWKVIERISCNDSNK